jgi:hypothetical protein
LPPIRLIFGVWFLILVAAYGCGPTPRAPLAEEIFEEPKPIRSLVVLPTTYPVPLRPDIDPLLLQGGAETLDRVLNNYFREHREQVRILSPKEQEKILGAEFTGSNLEMARVIGRQLESDSVMLVMVERYLERVGTSYAADYPASVAIRFRIIDVASGNNICVGVFDETQRPLSADVLRLPQMAKRGFKWLTAAELAREGLHRELKACPSLQQLLQPNNPLSHQ